jgi:hypothetical protein
VAAVEQVALLHDIGKIGVPDAILQKPGPLTAAEWRVMHEHPAIGARIVASIPSLAHLAPAIRAEHERWDGRGYPDGLRGETIPLASRVILACDAFHAMTSDRPYRAKMAVTAAASELRAGAGTQFDPAVVAALLAYVDEVLETQPEPDRLPRVLVVEDDPVLRRALSEGLGSRASRPTRSPRRRPPTPSSPTCSPTSSCWTGGSRRARRAPRRAGCCARPTRTRRSSCSPGWATCATGAPRSTRARRSSC